MAATLRTYATIAGARRAVDRLAKTFPAWTFEPAPDPRPGHWAYVVRATQYPPLSVSPCRVAYVGRGKFAPLGGA